MSLKIYLYALGIWFVLMFLGILNGVVREGVYASYVGEWEAHVISTVIMIVVVILVTVLFLNNVISGYTSAQLVLVGVLWVALTVVFEFGFGRYVVGHTWGELLADYNILEGRVWSLVLLTLLTAPSLLEKIINQ